MKATIIFLMLGSIFFFVFGLDDIEMIVDVINSFDKPASIFANVCWSSVFKVNLTAELASMGRAKSIYFITDANISDLRLTQNHNLFFIVDTKCSTTEDFLKKANAESLFSNRCRWLILGDSGNNTSDIPVPLVNLTVLIDSEVILSRLHDDVFILNMIYKIKKNNENWKVEFFGNWTSSIGLVKSARMNIVTSMRRRNFENNVVTTSMIAVDNSTIDNIYDLRNIEIDTVSKANIRHIDALYDFINATRIIKFTNTWGYFINGSWNGIVGHFVRGESDIAASVMFITLERLTSVQFICLPTNIIVDFVFREPPLSYHSNLFLLPFNKSVWGCIAAFILILMLIIYINAYWESIKLKRAKKLSDCSAVRPNMSDIAVLLISAMCQQGSSIELKGGVGRIIMFLIFLTFLFLYTSYSASIVALLQSSSTHIRNLADLYNSKMELGIENLPYNIYYFTVAKEPLKKAIFENRIAPKGQPPNYLTLEEGVKRLQTKPFAFNMNIGVGYRLVNKYFQEHEKCGLQQITYIENNKPWLSCAKHSPYTEIFKIGLQRSLEHGLLDRVNRLIYTEKPLCSVRGGSFISVNIMDFYPVLLMLLYGMMFSITFLFIEIIIHRRHVQISRRFQHYSH